jgi:HptB-dependent secretion and biofilm anti anti-sigma factor
MLRVDIQSASATVTLRCSGRIVLGLEAETLRCMTTSRSERCLVLDLREVRAIDAAGLGLLVELHSWAQGRARMLTIASPSRQVLRLIAITNLHSVLQIVDSTDSALSDCYTSRDEAGTTQAMTA